jgi:hypothetical protein
MIHSTPSVIPLIERLRAEYAELPSLRLTPAQVRRLCGVDDALLCNAVLRALVEIGFLAQNADGRYVRGRSDGAAAGVSAFSTQGDDHKRNRSR